MTKIHYKEIGWSQNIISQHSISNGTRAECSNSEPSDKNIQIGRVKQKLSGIFKMG